MKTLKDYLEETIRRYGAVGSSRGMGYTLENDQLDEILGPDQLSKLQSIKSQLPKVGGQKPSVPTDADRAEADAWLAGLKGGTPAAAPAASGDAPINFDRPGRPRSVSHGELQNKIAKLKSIKGLLKSISKMEPKATRAANKVGGSEEIATKSQMMQDMINNLNISYTSGQELDSIERRMGEYLQQLTAKGAAWTRPTRANKSGAVTIIKPGQGEIAEDDVEEGLKQKAAGVALAGAMALGAGGAQAQSTDRFDPAWGTSGYDTSIRSDKSLTRSMNSADPSKDVNDFQRRIQSVTGPNAKGEYKVVVIQGNDIVSHYVTKTPPKSWMFKEDITQEDIITKLKAKLGDYLSDLGQQIKKDPALQDKLSAKTPGDQVGPPVKTLTTDDGHEISIHGNEDDGFRISIKNKQTPSKFDSLDEAVMACEMYRAHRRKQALNADYVEEA